jgi:hypothetical protein
LPVQARALVDEVPMTTRALLSMLALLGLASCVTSKGTLEGSRAETVRVDGRLYEVRVAPVETAGEYRLLLVRGTVVVDPDPKLESERNWNVVQPFMERTCKGAFVVLDHQLADKVNLYVRFRCGT